MTAKRLIRSILYTMFLGSFLVSADQIFAQRKTDPLVRRLFPEELVRARSQAGKEGLRLGVLVQERRSEEKSVFKAVLLSLLLPGMGELYGGGFRTGKYFLFAESGLWLTFTSVEVYGHWLQNDARTFAGRHASANIEGKDDQFFVNLGNFKSVYDYNEKKLRDRDPSRLYDPNGPFFWQWDNEESRMRFRDLRVKSDRVLNSVRFIVGAIIVNHIASAVHARQIVSRRNTEVSGGTWDVQAGILGSLSRPNGVVLNVRKSF